MSLNYISPAAEYVHRCRMAAAGDLAARAKALRLLRVLTSAPVADLPPIRVDGPARMHQLVVSGQLHPLPAVPFKHPRTYLPFLWLLPGSPQAFLLVGARPRAPRRLGEEGRSTSRHLFRAGNRRPSHSRN